LPVALLIFVEEIAQAGVFLQEPERPLCKFFIFKFAEPAPFLTQTTCAKFFVTSASLLVTKEMQ